MVSHGELHMALISTILLQQAFQDHYLFDKLSK